MSVGEATGDFTTTVALEHSGLPSQEAAAVAGGRVRSRQHDPLDENIETVEWRTPPPLAGGSRLAFAARFLGRRLEYTYDVHEHIPGKRFVMSTSEGPFPMETTYAFADEGRRRPDLQRASIRSPHLAAP